MSQFGFATLRKQAGALGARDEASDRKTADFMMDGVYFGALSVVFGTVRQFFRHFDDGRSDGWLDEWPERRLPRRFASRNDVKGYVKRLPEQFRESLTVLWR